MTRWLAALCAGMALLTGPALADETPPLAAALVAEIDARSETAERLLEQLVNVNSGTMNFAGVREVGRMLAPEFEALGFETHWIDGEAFGRAGHLVATRAGRGPRVVLIGHLDTVFEPDSPFQRFEPLPGDRARGPGVIDMKGGIVVMLQALHAVAATRGLDGLDLRVVLNGDEELPGAPLALARRALIEAAQGADVAIGFEDGDGRLETAVISRRGSLPWTLETTGRPAHSSLIFTEEVGSGAIYEMARIVAAFHDALAGEPYLTLNPGVVLGGTSIEFDPDEHRGVAFGKKNVVAESSIASGDLRTLTPEQLKRARSVMTDIVADHLPDTEARIVFEEGYPPMAPTDANRRLLSMLDAASRDLGFGPVTAVDPRDAGAADVSFVAAEVGMAIDGVGLTGTGGHTVEETADLPALRVQAARVALLLARLAP